MIIKSIKRTIDIIGSITALILVLPLLIVTAIAIKIESKGPVLYKQERVGLNNQLFTICKFRSMYVNNIADAPSPGHDFDPRVTKVGRIIRKTSIDEVPQLFNVLSGKMSLVGPRAITTNAVNDRIAGYVMKKQMEKAKVEDIYIIRHTVKPGITGLTQVNGRSEAGVIAATELDLKYAQEHSLKMDLEILIKTVKIVLTKKGTN
ncbi:MAG: sugar transferase [Bacillota bacterium]|nr:sugar transferase [Bacillota bacterium]